MAPEEQVRINNFKAHYNSIVAEIAAVNSTLTETIEKNTEVEETYSSLLGRISDAHKELSETIEKTRLYQSEFTQKEKSLTEREQSFANEKALFNSYVEDQLLTIEKKQAAFDTEQVIYNESIESLLNRLHELQGEAQEASRTLDVRKNAVAELTRQLVELNDTLQKSIQEGEQTTTALNKSIKEKEQELADITLETLDNKAKVAKPLQLLAERELAVAKRERDFEIMFARLNKVFKKMYPDQQLSI